MKYKNLQDFMTSFGLARKLEGESIEERHESFVKDMAPNKENIIYCRGCGQALMTGGYTPAEQKRYENERRMQFHEKCYREAEANYMARMKREANYRDEESIE